MTPGSLIDHLLGKLIVLGKVEAFPDSAHCFWDKRHMSDMVKGVHGMPGGEAVQKDLTFMVQSYPSKDEL